MASLLHCLFRHCFEHGDSSDEDEDHQHHQHREDTSEDLYCGSGTRRGSRRGRIAGARRRNYLGLASSPGGAGGTAATPPYGNRISRGNSFRGENADDATTTASSTAADTAEGAGGDGGGRDASCEAAGGGGGGGGFFRRWIHQINRDHAQQQHQEGTENLLLAASSPARSEDYGPDCISFSTPPPLAGDAGAAAVSSLVAGPDSPMLLSRPPMSMPPSAQLRGLIGLVRRSSDAASPADTDDEKHSLTPTKKLDSMDDDRQRRLAAAKHHNASFKEAVEYDFSTGREYPSISSNEVVLPGSELQRKMAKLMCRELGRGTSSSSVSSQNEAAAAVSSGDPGDECVICMDCFTPDNPRMPTLCGCGENKTYFHLPCLYQWIDQCPDCPSCRKKLVWEEF